LKNAPSWNECVINLLDAFDSYIKYFETQSYILI
jgi:hypothetical protein